MKGKKWYFVIVAAVLIVAVVIGAVVLTGQDRGSDPGESTPTQLEDTQPIMDENQMSEEEMMEAANLEAFPVLSRDNYTSQSNSAEDMAAKGVTMEGLEMNNGKFSVWYWECYYELVEGLGEYAAYYGLNTAAPLENQECTLTDVPMTWQQFMIDETLYYWHSTASLALEAKAAGLSASQEEMTALQEQLEETASAQGYSSALSMIQSKYGSCVTVEDYLEVAETKILADTYYVNQLEALTPEHGEVSAYYDENSASLEKQGIRKDDMPANVTIRQILVKPEGNAILAGTYSREQMDGAQAVAQDILAKWSAEDGTEDGFAALVKDNSSDTATKFTGGLYEALVPGEIPSSSINEWCFDSARKAGDTVIVESNSGVHILYFISASEDSYWFTTVKDTMMQDRMEAMLTQAREAHPYEVDFAKLLITTLIPPEEDN